ncbi:MAG: Cys-tRNA(Pro) deacylase [Clostridia bacterium]|nr:Cys-tRNA(Pro) deacylase [Clostridia bacterium]
MAKNVKTNVMRLLDGAKIAYTDHCYVESGVVSGVDVARVLDQPPERVFKTLVTVGASKEHYVFVVPVEKELDLKKAARAVGEKSVAMIHAKELLPLTGYIHGGCSPIGMKKFFTTTVDASAQEQETICVSAGKIGYQVELAPADLGKMIRLTYADITA